MWALMVLIIAFCWLAARGVSLRPQTRLQAVVELGINMGIDFFAGVMGSRRRVLRFFPLLGTFFIFILVGNYSGLIPGAGEITGFKPPTSHWGVTGGLAAVVFFATQYFGLKEKGLRHYKHFFEPLFLFPIMLPLGILEELVRPFSLSLRLFANIFGGETVLLALLLAVPYFLPITTLFLELIFGFVQAVIFTMLTAVYFSQAVSEGGH